MKRLALFITGGAIWLLLLAIPVLADNGPHVRGQATNAATGSCAACHRAHSGQAPDLLKTQASTLCYSCHGAGNIGATTDVEDGVAFATTATQHSTGVPTGYVGALRGGGFEYALIATDTVAGQPSGMPSNGSTLGRVANIPVAGTPEVTTSAHSVDGSAVTMWGAGADAIGSTGKADVQLTCASCHDPHGNGQYRILKPTPDDVVANADVAAVKINDATIKSYIATSYGVDAQVAADTAESPLNSDGSSINYTASNKTFQGTYLEASSRWCATCHTRYFGVSGAAGNVPWMEDGSADATFTFRHATRNIVDPHQRGLASPLPATITPITTSSQVPAGSVLGTAGTGASALRGVAVNPGTTTSAVIRASSLADGQDGDNLATGAPRCITCHVSHGSNATAGSVVDLETSIVTYQTGMGSTLLRLDGRTVCQACHAK